jgi:Rrf2 family protein
MRISSLEEYGLRCALQLARAYSRQEPLSASSIAEREGISVEYVSKIMRFLKKAKLVQALRGVQGGFVLAKDPHALSLAAVFESLQEKKSSQSLEDFCECHAGKGKSCVHLGDCQIQPVWMLVLGGVGQIFENLSLGDLLDSRPNLLSRVRHVASETLAKVFISHERSNEGVHQ